MNDVTLGVIAGLAWLGAVITILLFFKGARG